MRRCLLILVAIGLVAPAAARARGPSWGPPVAVAHEAFDVYLPFFVRSPGRHQLVVAEDSLDKTHVKVSARRRDGSWEPIVFPAVNPVEELPWSVGVNDHGTIAVSWPSNAPNPPSRNDYIFCWCRAEGAVRTRHGVFGPVHTFTGASRDKWPPELFVNPDDTTTALWAHGRTVRTVDADPAGRFGRARVVARDARDWEVARTHGGRPFLELLVGKDWFGATHPFEQRHRIPAPGFGNVIADDNHGHEVSASYNDVGITVAYRHVGGTFGRPHLVAPTNYRDLCNPSVAMNAHQLVFVVWTCATESGRHDYAQGALVAPGGRVISLSGRRPALAGVDDPGIDLDDHGRGVAAWESGNYHDISSLVVTGGRLAGFRHVSRLRGDASGTTVGTTVDRRGHGLATWAYNSNDRGTSEIEVATIDLRSGAD
jgi:hypothetical protein